MCGLVMGLVCKDVMIVVSFQSSQVIVTVSLGSVGDNARNRKLKPAVAERPRDCELSEALVMGPGSTRSILHKNSKTNFNSKGHGCFNALGFIEKRKKSRVQRKEEVACFLT